MKRARCWPTSTEHLFSVASLKFIGKFFVSFTEGFDTADLKDAKALLGGLNG